MISIVEAEFRPVLTRVLHELSSILYTAAVECEQVGQSEGDAISPTTVEERQLARSVAEETIRRSIEAVTTKAYREAGGSAFAGSVEIDSDSLDFLLRLMETFSPERADCVAAVA